MPGLDVGRIFATLGGDYESRGFDMFGRAIEDSRRKAAKPVTAKGEMDVDKSGFREFDRDLSEARRKAAKPVKAKAEVDVDDSGFRRFEQGAARAASSARGMNLNILGLSGRVQSLAKIAGAAAIPLTQLAASLTAAAGGAAALGAGFAAAMAPVGAIAAATASRFGLVSEAYKAMDKASSGAGSDAASKLNAQKSAAEGVRTAQQALASSQRGVTRAQEDLTAARKDATEQLADMRREVKRAALDEESAVLSVKEARAALREAEQDPGASLLDIERAQLNLRQAKQDLSDTRAEGAQLKRENAQAQRGGVEGAPGVVEARRGLAEANRQVAESARQVKLAQEDMATAAASTSAGADAAAAAMAKLTRAERQMVTSMARMRDAIRKGLGGGTENVFEGLNRSIAKLAPAIERQRPVFTRIGAEIEKSLGRATKVITGPEFTRSFSEFGRSGARMLRPLTSIGLDLFRVFTRVARQALPFVEKGLKGIADATGGLRSSTRDSDKLAGTVRRLVGHFNDWMDLLKATGRLIANVFGGTEDDGQKLVRTLTRIVNAMNRFVTAFREGDGTAGDLKDSLQFLWDIVTAVLGVTGRLTRAIAGNEKAMNLLIDAVTAGYIAYRIYRLAVLVSSAAMAAQRVIVTLLTVGYRAYRAAIVAAGIAARGFAIIMRVVNTVMRLNPIGLVITALVLLGAALVTAYKKSETFRDIVDKAFTAVKDAAGEVVNAYLGLVSGFIQGLEKMLGALPDKLVPDSWVKGLKDARKGIDDMRETARKWGDDDDAQRAARKHKEAMEDMRDQNKKTAKSWDDLRKSGKTDMDSIRKNVKSNTDRIKKAMDEDSTEGRKALAKNFRTARTAIRKSMQEGETSTKEGMKEIRELLAKELQATYGISIKAARHQVTKARVTAATGGSPANASTDPNQRGGRVKRLFAGGWIGGRGMVSDDVVPIAPNAIAAYGEYFAKGPGGGAVINRHQAPIVEALLGRPLDALPRGNSLPYIERAMGGPGGLDALFASVTRPHMFQAGGMVPIPGQPGEFIHSSILPDVMMLIRQYKLKISDGYSLDPVHTANGEHPKGLAIDAGPDPSKGGTWGLVDRLAAWAEPGGRPRHPFRWVGYNGDVNHGTGNHIHLSWLAGANIRGAPTTVASLPRQVVHGGGLYGQIVQGAADQARAGANRLLNAAYAAGSGTEAGGTSAGSLSVAEMAALWKRVNPGNGNPRLMGAIGMAESTGNPQAVGPSTSGGRARGLWQIMWPLHQASFPNRNPFNTTDNAYMAGSLLKSQGLGAWEAYTRGLHSKYLGPGGRFNGGGRTSPASGRSRKKSTRKPPNPATAAGRVAIGARLQGTQNDRVQQFDDVVAEIEVLDRRYVIADRKYDMSTEELVDEESGAVNVAAVKKRAKELTELLRIRQKIVDKYRRARDIIFRVRKSYREMIGKMQRALRATAKTKKKKRAGYKSLIDMYKRRVAEWGTKLTDANLDLAESRLDRDEIKQERAEVYGTAPTPKEPDPGDGGDGGDEGGGGEGGGEGGPTETLVPPTPEQIAQEAAAQLATFQESRRQTFATYGANAVAAGQSPFASPTAQAAGLRYFGAMGVAEAPGTAYEAGGGGVVVTNNYQAPPPDPHTWSQGLAWELRTAFGS